MTHREKRQQALIELVGTLRRLMAVQMLGDELVWGALSVLDAAIKELLAEAGEIPDDGSQEMHPALTAVLVQLDGYSQFTAATRQDLSMATS